MILIYSAVIVLSILLCAYLYSTLPIAWKQFKMMHTSYELIEVSGARFELFIDTYVHDLGMLNTYSINAGNKKNTISYNLNDKGGICRASSITWPHKTYFFICPQWEQLINDRPE